MAISPYSYLRKKQMIKRTVLRFIQLFGPLLTFLSAVWLKVVKKMGTGTYEDKIFMKLGILPILDHYYQPMINPKKHLTKSLRDDRDLKGIDLNTEEQLKLLTLFKFNEELVTFPLNKREEMEFYYYNGIYEIGDSEYLYNMVRYFKPGRIIEIGSGYSTLMMRNAIVNNMSDDSSYMCNQICIEPYENIWLESLDVTLIRERVERTDKALFQSLKVNDILFIDSSHIIRPQGDVLFEYLEILPTLQSGVIIHVHDIFTPKDYLDQFVYNHYLWNEQYLLEAFLTFNYEFEIIGALNYLRHNYRKELSEKCPVFAKTHDCEPAAFWMRRK